MFIRSQLNMNDPLNLLEIMRAQNPHSFETREVIVPLESISMLSVIGHDESVEYVMAHLKTGEKIPLATYLSRDEIDEMFREMWEAAEQNKAVYSMPDSDMAPISDLVGVPVNDEYESFENDYSHIETQEANIVFGNEEDVGPEIVFGDEEKAYEDMAALDISETISEETREAMLSYEPGADEEEPEEVKTEETVTFSDVEKELAKED